MTNEEKEVQQFLKNEEKLWDLAAITAAPTILHAILEYRYEKKSTNMTEESIVNRAVRRAYDLADALIAERKRRFLKDPKEKPNA